MGNIGASFLGNIVNQAQQSSDGRMQAQQKLADISANEQFFSSFIKNQVDGNSSLADLNNGRSRDLKEKTAAIASQR